MWDCDVLGCKKRYGKSPTSGAWSSGTNVNLKVDRLDFFGGMPPSLSINYVGICKDMEKKLTQLYYIKMKISCDLGFFCNESLHGNVMKPLRFIFIFVFLCTRSFF